MNYQDFCGAGCVELLDVTMPASGNKRAALITLNRLKQQQDIEVYREDSFDPFNISI
jgi:hypothetical protein